MSSADSVVDMDTRLTYPSSLALIRQARCRGVMSIVPLADNPEWGLVDHRPIEQEVMLGYGSLGKPRILVPKNNRTYAGCVDTRVCEEILPSGSFVRITRGGYRYVLSESPALIVVRAAAECQAVGRGIPDSLAVMAVAALITELCGTYSFSATDQIGEECCFGREPVLSMSELNRYLSEARGIRGLRLARRAAKLAFENSFSPRETCIALMLCSPPCYGGLGLSRPVLNSPLTFTDHQRTLLWHESMRPDLFWELYRLVIEYNGGTHDSLESKTEDDRRTLDYAVCGIEVFTIRDSDISSVLAMEQLGRKCVEVMSRTARKRLVDSFLRRIESGARPEVREAALDILLHRGRRVWL